MKNFFIGVFVLSFLMGSSASAQVDTKGTTTPLLATYNTCKKTALVKKEKALNNSRRDYARESNTITNEAKISLEIVKWRILSSFRTESRKILDEQKAKLDTLAVKTITMKKGAEETWKAEDALCTFNYERQLKKK